MNCKAMNSRILYHKTSESGRSPNLDTGADDAPLVPIQRVCDCL
jgi:hypothetical protein